MQALFKYVMFKSNSNAYKSTVHPTDSMFTHLMIKSG